MAHVRSGCAALGALLAVLLVTPAAAAPDGPAPDLPLEISPAAGSTANTAPIGLAGTAPCPSGTESLVVLIEGGPFADETVAVGNIPYDGVNPAAAIAVPFDELAARQSPQVPRPLTGVSTLRLQCADQFATMSYQDFVREIDFRPEPDRGTSTFSTIPQSSEPTPSPQPTDSPSVAEVSTPPPTPGAPGPTAGPAAVAAATAPPPTVTPAVDQQAGAIDADIPQDVQLVVPASDPAPGLLTISSSSGGGGVTMGTPTTGTDGVTQWLNYSAPMPRFTVTDNRVGLLPWSLVGQVSNFSGGVVFARYLGWTPEVVQAGLGATAGPWIDPGYPGTGTGLSTSRILGGTPQGHNGVDGFGSVVFGGALDLHVPTTVPAGSYVATVTLTLIS